MLTDSIGKHTDDRGPRSATGGPRRRNKRLVSVWIAAVVATTLLQTAETSAFSTRIALPSWSSSSLSSSRSSWSGRQSSSVGRRQRLFAAVATSSVLLRDEEKDGLKDGAAFSIVVDKETEDEESMEETFRPLQQNWWPVAVVDTLDQTKPNAITALNKPLVVWYDDGGDVAGADGDGIWRVHDDLCPHRFAPLSEGRIVQATKPKTTVTTTGSSSNNRNTGCGGSKCLQCAYHGWEFDGASGSCTFIPQQQESSSSDTRQKEMKKSELGTYPTHTVVGMLWVWMDPTTPPAKPEASIPVSPLLQEWYRQYPETIYQRDLPYGYELAGENVIDISHLPWAHHGVISSRDQTRSIPYKMLTTSEKEQVQVLERQGDFAPPGHHDGSSDTPPPFTASIPAFQAKIQDPHIHDPVIGFNMKRFGGDGKSGPDETGFSYVGFYPPSHIRYYRDPSTGSKDDDGELNFNDGASTTELYVCPTTPGRSRVIIFNPFEMAMKPSNDVKLRKQPLLTRIQRFLLRNIIRITAINGVTFHHITSNVFDGDNVFLSQQAQLQKKYGLGYREYLSPTSADQMTNIFRRWVDKAVKVTKDHAERRGSSKRDKKVANMIVQSVIGGSSSSTDIVGQSPADASSTNLPREHFLDRFEAHTKSCPVCLTALRRLEKRRDILRDKVLPIMYGVVGSSLFYAGMSAFGASSTLASAIKLVSRKAMSVTIGSMFVSFLANKYLKILNKQIRQFYFEDYVHQEKE